MILIAPTGDKPAAPSGVVAALHVALSSALANLEDMVGDPSAPLVVSAADIAALATLLADDGTGQAAILAYL